MAQNNSTLYLLSYANYFNRIVKREDTVDAYLHYKVYEPLVCNFNPADGIDTEHIFNFPYLANTPAADYCVVVDETNTITSRWFIVNANRMRGGQYRLTLHRDLIADYYDEVVSAPCYIQKATVNAGSPLIFNSENITFNQIKKKEVELVDDTGSRWIVGYCATNAFDPYLSQETTIQPGHIEAKPFITAKNVNGIEYSNLLALTKKSGLYNENPSYIRYSIDHNIKYGDTFAYSENVKDYFDMTNGYLYSAKTPFKNRRYLGPNLQQSIQLKEAGFERPLDSAKNNLTDKAKDYLKAQNQANNEYLSGSFIELLMNNQNKLLRDNSSNIFSFTFKQIGEGTFAENDFDYSNAGNFGTAFKEIIDRTLLYTDTGSNLLEYGFSVEGNFPRYALEIVSNPSTDAIITDLTPNNRNLVDAPYKMFAIPYDEVIFNEVRGDNVYAFRSNPILCRNIASEIANDLSGSGSLYDIQILPYCPCADWISPVIRPDLGGTMGIMLPDNATGENYSLIFDSGKDAGNEVGAVLFARSESFSFTIRHEIEIPTNPIEFKVEHETSMWRLNSPNYSGSFEFKATSNRGIKGFEVNCTYKPYQPYIHINPVFNSNGLYGGDYNDARGLVCSGDFSFPTTSEAWKTYQIQNKAYSDLHKLDITNMDKTYEIQKEQMETAGIFSALGAGVSGGTSGAMLGSFAGPGGALIGGALGGLTSALFSGMAASADLEYAERLHNQSKTYAEGRYDLSLQNVKALPYSLGKIGNNNIDTKRAPFLEYYTATDTEKQALRDKITYNGMTINAIGTISSYQQEIPSFIQGQIIRLEGIAEDYHCASAIANEINKGVYI